MKKTSILLSVFFWATLLVAQEITVTSPNQHSVWEKGVMNTITWSATGTSGVYKITYQEKDKNPVLLAQDILGDHYFFLTPEAPSYESKIVVLDQNNPAINDESDPFFNASYKSLMIKPIDNDHPFSPGFEYPVQWRDNSTGFTYFVQMLKDGESAPTLLAGELSDTTYNWVMPSVPGKYRLIVGMVGYPLTNDTSNVVTVEGIQNNITIIHPSGQTLKNDDFFDVEWVSTRDSAKYTIYMRRYDTYGLDWDSVYYFSQPGFRHNATVSYEGNSGWDYELRIEDEHGNFAQSAPFSFGYGPLIELYNPNNFDGINQVGATKVLGDTEGAGDDLQFVFQLNHPTTGEGIKSYEWSQGQTQFSGDIFLFPGEVTTDSVFLEISANPRFGGSTALWRGRVKVNKNPILAFAPNYNKTGLTRGGKYLIEWYSNYTPDQGVSLFGLSEHGQEIFIADVPSGNSYLWNIPTTLDQAYLNLMVRDKKNPTIKHVSEVYYLSSVNFIFDDGNAYEVGSDVRFNWITKPGKTYSLYVRPDKSAPWDTLLTNASYSNSTANYLWKVNDYQFKFDENGYCTGEVKIEENGDPFYGLIKDIKFTNLPSISLIYPSTTDSVKTNSMFGIQYSTASPGATFVGKLTSDGDLSLQSYDLSLSPFANIGTYSNSFFLQRGRGEVWLHPTIFDYRHGTRSAFGIYNTDIIKPVLLRPGVPGQVIYNDHLRVQWGYYNRHALIELSSDGGATWQKLAERNFDNRDTVFTVNERVISDNCLIRLTCEGKTVVSEPFKLRSINPFITEVKDVKNDDGGRVILKWKGFKNDTPNNVFHQTGYVIWRALVANYLKPQSPAIAWEYVATVPSAGFEEYAFTTPTILDSTKSGVALHHFMVSYTEGFTGTVYYSNTISGYSVDNIIPVKPENVKASGFESSVALKWNANSEKDIKFYEVYRSTAPGGTDTAKTVYAVTSDTLYMDANPLKQTMYYRLAAVDKHDNRSEKSNEVAFTPVDVEAGDMVYNYELYANYPNPFNPSTTISFSLKNPGYTKIQIYDMLGNHIRTIAEGEYAAGKHRMVFDATGLASGMYYYSVTSGEFTATKKMVLVK